MMHFGNGDKLNSMAREGAGITVIVASFSVLPSMFQQFCFRLRQRRGSNSEIHAALTSATNLSISGHEQTVTQCYLQIQTNVALVTLVIQQPRV